VRGAQLLVLNGFALAQPLLDILSKNPAFFAIRRSSSSEIVFFALFLVFVPPAVMLAVELLVGLVSQRAAEVLHLVFVAGLVAVVVLHALTNDSGLTGKGSLIVAAAAGVGGAILYQRVAAARSFLTVLTPAPFIFLALFFSSSGIHKLVFVHTPPVKQEHVGSKTPVVLIIFDEFAPVALMNKSEHIDAERYPNFAKLAGTSTWYRSATTVQWLSEIAVPAVMTGILPPPNKKLLPTYADHPKSIFTLLNGSYRVTGVESLTNLCPGSICKNEKGSSTAEVKNTTGSLANDASIVYLHLLLPHPWADDIPAISDSWGDFGQAEHEAVARKTSRGPLLPCARNVCRFTQTFKRRGKPGLYVIHTLLPHVPYLYLPSGRRYGIEVPILRGVQAGYWKQDWPALQSYQRFLLQVEYTDRALGYMMRRLRAAGLWDRAVVIAVADHGVSFRHEQPRRLPTPGNLQDIAFVPLFVKLPHQHRARIDDGLARTIDVVPTIARALHIKIPWHVDGHPLVGRRPPADGEVSLLVGDGKYATGRLSALKALRAQALRDQLSVFGTTPGDLYRIGPHRELLGRLVSGLQVTPSHSGSVSLENQNLLQAVDTHSDLLPTWIQGDLTGVGPNEDLAVAVNGRIAAMTQSFPVGGQSKFDAMVPEDSLHDGRNNVSVYLVQGNGLEELRGSNVSTTIRGNTIASGAKALPIRPHALQGRVHVARGQNFTFTGWASNPGLTQKVDSVMVFVDREQVYASKISLIQPHTMLGSSVAHQKYAFQFELPQALLPKPGAAHTVRVFALKNGVATELTTTGSWPWSR
jgi:sulfatase-like protein